MTDLQAELARFEAELAGTSATPPGPPPPPATLPGPPTLQSPPPAPAGLQHPPSQGWQGSAPIQLRPQAAMPPPPMMQPPAAGYYAPVQAPAAMASAYGYAPPVQHGIDPSKAELLTGIKAAFASQKVTKKSKVGVAREAAGKKWIDPNLLEWPENDFRIFVGDLGNETNDDVLNKAFARFPCFNKAKVVRDKKTNKTKGFGFASFSDPIEGAKALREMDGKYIGNRPCKLRKSTWQERSQADQKFVPGKGKKKNHLAGAVAKQSGFLHR